MSYQDTSLWKRTLGQNDPNVEPLRNSFLRAREHAEFLLGKIRKDFPNLTVHDITHVDSLWNVADTIIGKDYPINPLEGYILGISFLIHDAALSYDTVGGIDKLRDTIQWKDAYADGTGEKDDAEFKKECDFLAIRAIHAREAERLLSQLFARDNGSTFYIIDNDSYRKHFGSLIGKIAASHHWDIDKVESELKKQINPRSKMPNDWKINAQKLACILRCADAGHIDDGRAPDAIYQSLLVNGVSRYHWESQNHLCQVCEDENDKTKLCITSSNPFKKEEELAVAAWHVAYDAVRIFDEELKKSNNLLIANHIKEFPHNGVSGANSKEDLAKYIETEGWQPCNFGVHTSNIKNLIETLGGSKLYGENNMILVVLRELIQNARDAIHARQKMDDSFRDGRITIRLLEDGKNRFIEVEDNGIGMSMDCIKNHLLDFGSSYWKSSLSKLENPGLRSSKFKSVGKFGIGFYSVFMVAKSVEVRTKRYNKAIDDAKKIEFPKGLTLSPIISNDIMSASQSTIVRFELKDDVEFLFIISKYYSKVKLSLEGALPILVTALDTDVFYESHGYSQKIHSNIFSPDFDRSKWLSSLFKLCPLHKIDVFDVIASKMEVLIDENGEQRGMILPPEYNTNLPSPIDGGTYFPGIQTIGGLLSSLNLNDSFDSGFIGYLNGKENSISRNQMNIDEPLMNCLKAWTKKKYQENHEKMLNNSSIADAYCKLVNFCELEDTLVNDNIRRLYENKGSEIEVKSIRGLMNIHYYLYVGINSSAGNLKLANSVQLGMEEIDAILDFTKSGKTLDELSDELSEKEYYEQYYEQPFEQSSVAPDKLSYDTYKMRSIFSDNDAGRKSILMLKILLRINNMPASRDDEIIRKYDDYLGVYPFFLGNEEALGVWVNLMLYKVSGKMIDWRKVDAIRIKIIHGRLHPNDALCNYLKSFLSSTYLSEITAT